MEVEQHSDILDTAQDISQRERDVQVALIQSKIKPIEKSKVCLQCSNKTLKGARWCDKSCRDDWQQWNPEA